VLFIVDGMNVIGAQPDGWWRDRGAARRRLVEALAQRDDDRADVTVVFDGRPEPGDEDHGAAAGVRVAYAPGGPNAADDAIVEMVRSLARPSETVVVTSDRALAQRVRTLGANVEGAATFRSRLPKAP
jgi:predicted RNA-binding protein with PIN domain